MSQARLLEVVAALPEYSLLALDLMNEGKLPQTPEDIQRFALATLQIVEYGKRCTKTVEALVGLRPIAAEEAALVEAFPL